MKVAILAESQAEVPFLSRITRAVVNQPVEVLEPNLVPPNGWSSLKSVMSEVIKHHHYSTEAEGLIICADSDHTLFPALEGKIHDGRPPNRLVEMTEEVRRTLGSIEPRTGGRPPLKVAVGLAIPCLEAWALAGISDLASTTSFAAFMTSPPPPSPALVKLQYKHQLKDELYGSSRAGMEKMKSRLTERAEALAQDLSVLERSFPYGFGALAAELKTWG